MNSPTGPVDRRWRREEIEGLASNVLQQFELYAIPVDPVVLTAHLNIRVNNAVFANERISGMIAKRGDDKLLLVNQNDHPYRKRFTIAHELGHHFLHLAERDGDYVDTEADLFRSEGAGPRPQEVEANQFAAALLMPGELLKWEIAQNEGISLEELAMRFRVSESAMGIRLDVLGLELPVGNDAGEALGTR